MASINCISWEEVVLGRLTEITEIWSRRELRLLNCKLTHLRKRYIIFCKSFTDSIHIIRWSATSVIQTFLIEEILEKNCGNSVCSRLSENENFLPRLIDNKFEKEGGDPEIEIRQNRDRSSSYSLEAKKTIQGSQVSTCQCSQSQRKAVSVKQLADGSQETRHQCRHSVQANNFSKPPSKTPL